MLKYRLSGNNEKNHQNQGHILLMLCVLCFVQGQNSQRMFLFLSAFCYSLGFTSGSDGISEEVSFCLATKQLRFIIEPKVDLFRPNYFWQKASRIHRWTWFTYSGRRSQFYSPPWFCCDMGAALSTPNVIFVDKIVYTSIVVMEILIGAMKAERWKPNCLQFCFFFCLLNVASFIKWIEMFAILLQAIFTQVGHYIIV